MSEVTAFSSVLVVGGGAWGTALATLTARNNVETVIWAREPDAVTAINSRHENTSFLPGIILPENLRATNDLTAINDAEAIVFVVPAQFSRAILTELKQVAGMANVPVVLCSKGIEKSTGSLMSEVIEVVWPEAIPAVLSGPSFAADVATGRPTAVTLACADESIIQRWQKSLAHPSFRPYLSDDVTGAEIGGAVKNVLAIACGIVEGKDLGESARAALMARGFAEFQRLGVAIGAKPQTMGGLSGLGDLILTCSSRSSRNMSLGYEIGQGREVADILAGRKTVSEGAATARPVVMLGEKHNVEMPICTAVADIIDGKLSADEAMQSLLLRPIGHE